MADKIPPARLTGLLPFWDLFEHLRAAAEPTRPRMELTLEEYEQLPRSIWLGAVETWDDLREVCALLWVKPSVGDRQRQWFDRAFTGWQRGLDEASEPVPPPSVRLPADEPKDSPEQRKEKKMPDLPWRPMPEGELQVPAAVKLNSGIRPRDRYISPSDHWRFVLPDLPISALDVKEVWQLWRRLYRQPGQEIMDEGRTVAQMSPLGYIENIVWRKGSSRSLDLLVLVDVGDNMLTYLPVMAKLWEAIDHNLVSSARVYQFTSYPGRFLYDQRQPQQPVASEQILRQLHPDRTVLLVVSDCGASLGEDEGGREVGLLAFLQRWQRSVLPIIWLNPVLAERWGGTPAAVIQGQLGGRMVTPELFNRLSMARLLSAGG